MAIQAFEDLRQHELIIVRRLRTGPLTEFELAREVAENSSWTAEASVENIGEWLESLKSQGLIWCGRLYNDREQHVLAAALTRRGQELIQ